jgi:hypothetical protein
VKQQCESDEFIAINHKLEMDARVFKSNKWNGAKSKTAERQKEGVCETEHCWTGEEASAIK